MTTFVDVATNIDTSTAAATCPVTIPAGVQDGDCLIACVGAANKSGLVVTTPSGWTVLDLQPATPGTFGSCGGFVAVKENALASDSSTTVTFQLNLSAKHVAICQAWRGVATVTPAVLVVGRQNDAATSFTCETGTPSSQPYRLLRIGSQLTPATLSAPTNYTLPTGGQASTSGAAGSSNVTATICYLTAGDTTDLNAVGTEVIGSSAATQMNVTWTVGLSSGSASFVLTQAQQPMRMPIA